MTFSESTIQDLVQKYYGLTVTVKSLNGYDELNFILQQCFQFFLCQHFLR